MYVYLPVDILYILYVRISSGEVYIHKCVRVACFFVWLFCRYMTLVTITITVNSIYYKGKNWFGFADTLLYNI